MPTWVLIAALLELEKYTSCISAFYLSELCPAESAVPPGAAALLSSRSGGPASRRRDNGRGARAASALTASKKSSGRQNARRFGLAFILFFF